MQQALRPLRARYRVDPLAVEAGVGPGRGTAASRDRSSRIPIVRIAKPQPVSEAFCLCTRLDVARSSADLHLAICNTGGASGFRPPSLVARVSWLGVA